MMFHTFLVSMDDGGLDGAVTIKLCAPSQTGGVHRIYTHAYVMLVHDRIQAVAKINITVVLLQVMPTEPNVAGSSCRTPVTSAKYINVSVSRIPCL